MKKISIVVPVYHIAPYINRCINSILNQTYENIEIILVDDGGDDNCPDICDEYASKDSRVIVLHKYNEGASMARKSGLEIATGEYIMFVDGDDWIEEEMVEKMLSVQLIEDADIVLCGYKRMHQEAAMVTPLFDGYRVFDEMECQEIRRRMVGMLNEELSRPEDQDRLVTVWGKLYKKKCAFDGIWIDERKIGSLEDAVYNLGAFSECRKAAYLNQYLYCYRKDNEMSITSKYRSDIAERWEILYDFFENYIRKNHLGNDYITALYNRIALGILNIVLNETINVSSVFSKTKKIKSIMNMPRRKKALKQLRLNKFPIHWKVFYGCAKIHNAAGLLVIGKMIQIIRDKKC